VVSEATEPRSEYRVASRRWPDAGEPWRDLRAAEHVAELGDGQVFPRVQAQDLLIGRLELAIAASMSFAASSRELTASA